MVATTRDTRADGQVGIPHRHDQADTAEKSGDGWVTEGSWTMSWTKKGLFCGFPATLGNPSRLNSLNSASTASGSSALTGA